MRRLIIFCVFLMCCLLAHSQEKRPRIAFASDTQAPMFVEDIFLHSNQNKRATGMIFSDIVKEKPAALFILGDVVALGYKEKKWSNIDKYIKTCRDSGIYVTALLGNHDVMTRAKKGEISFQKRFNDHVRTGYVKVVDSVAVVLLNSNFSKMTETDRTAQQTWLQHTLDTLDHNPAIYATIVTCHHPPYTNSKIVGSNPDVQKYFVPVYVHSAKAKLFITGHSHNFESFKQQGKQFLVIGGGGGLHQPLSESANRLEDDASDYKPMFHYLLVERGREGLMVTSRFLKNDFSGFEKGRTFTVKY